MIPIRDNVPRVTMPVAVIAIIALNVAAFLYSRALDPRTMVEFFHIFGVVPARFFEPHWAAWAGYPQTMGWPLLSYMFLHGGWLHIILNMWMLWIFGDNIEDVTGHAGFVIFYLTCGLAAVGLHMAFEQTSQMPVVGASGAIAGVMGAYIVLYPHGRVLTLVPLFFVPLFFRLPSYFFLGFWFLTQVFSGWPPGPPAPTRSPGGRTWAGSWPGRCSSSCSGGAATASIATTRTPRTTTPRGTCRKAAPEASTSPPVRPRRAGPWIGIRFPGGWPRAPRCR